MHIHRWRALALLIGLALLAATGCGDGGDKQSIDQPSAIDPADVAKQIQAIKRQQEQVQNDLALYEVAIGRWQDELERSRRELEPLLFTRQQRMTLAQQLEVTRAELQSLDDRLRELNQQYDGLVMPREARRELLNVESDRNARQTSITQMQIDLDTFTQQLQGLNAAITAYEQASLSLDGAEADYQKLMNAAALLKTERERLERLLATLKQ